MRRSAFEAVGGYRDLAPSEDIDLWLRLHDAGFKLACLQETLLLYRIGVSSVSNQALARQTHLLKFAHHCHACRVAGQPEPTPEQFFAENPLSREELESVQVRRELRSSMGKLLGGKFVAGLGGLAASIVRNPGFFLHKVQSRWS
jgi:hypothetical protein